MKYVIKIKIEGEHYVEENELDAAAMESLIREDLASNCTLGDYDKSVVVKRVGP